MAPQQSDLVADPGLVDVLVTAVKDSMAAGRPLDGTRLGHILGDAYRQRNIATGPGAFKPVLETAVKQGHVKKVWNPQRTRMALILTDREVPEGWVEDNRSRALATPARGLPPETQYLRWELYEAFSGLRQSVSLDLSAPPEVRVVEAGPSHPVLTPLQPDEVVQAWTKFAAENHLSESATSAIVAKLGTSPTTVWGRIDVPGDDPSLRLGTRFHRRRLDLLVEHARKWFTVQGRDPAEYQLARLRTNNERAVGTPRAHPMADGGESTRERALRERLKRIIDLMSVEQLHELRIPAEFLET